MEWYKYRYLPRSNYEGKTNKFIQQEIKLNMDSITVFL